MPLEDVGVEVGAAMGDVLVVVGQHVFQGGEAAVVQGAREAMLRSDGMRNLPWLEGRLVGTARLDR